MSLYDVLMNQAPHRQKCVYCNHEDFCSGWAGLCNRRCYYGLCDLLEKYNTDSSEPDTRLVEYFTRYPSPGHTFHDEKIKAYIKGR